MKDMKLVGLRGEDAESYGIKWRRTIDCGHRWREGTTPKEMEIILWDQ